jgi:hypothetical protein
VNGEKWSPFDIHVRGDKRLGIMTGILGMGSILEDDVAIRFMGLS